MFKWFVDVVMFVFCFVVGACVYCFRESFTDGQLAVLTFGACVGFGWVWVYKSICVNGIQADLDRKDSHWRYWNGMFSNLKGEYERLRAKRCPRAGGWLVREWDGYFLRDDSDIRRDGRLGDEEAYSLFRLSPYGRVEILCGDLDWVLGKVEKIIEDDRGCWFLVGLCMMVGLLWLDR